MSNSLTPVQILREGYRLWDESLGQTTDYWLRHFADQFVVRSVDSQSGLPTATGDITTREQLLKFFQAQQRDWRMIHMTIDSYVADGDHVIARGSTEWEHRMSGRRFSSAKIDFWRFFDGKIVEYYGYFDTAAMRDAMQVDALAELR